MELKRRWGWMVGALVLAALLFRPVSASAQSGSVRGTVVDPQGAVVSGASVTLLRDGEQAADTSSDARGEFAFQNVAEGRYQVEVSAPGFNVRRTDPTFAGAPVIRVALQIGPLRQDVVVTAAATELPASQAGAAVTVLDSQTLHSLGKVDVLEPLRTVPGVQVVQTGPRGGTTSLFVRGGNANFNKVLIDGVPANDIGGDFDFGQLATTGVDRIEVLRAANSVLYGSDAMAGVVDITTRRGRFRVPEAAYSIDGGNLGTFRQAGLIAGAVKRFDYFSEVSRFTTDNDLPNNDYRNMTYAGRFGVFAGTNTDISGTVRVTDTEYGSPSAFNYFLIADDSRQDNKIRYGSVAVQSQWNNRLRTTARYGVSDQSGHYLDPAATGDPTDFGIFVGKPVTIRGANGATVIGRGILDFGGPHPYKFDATATRHLISGQGDYQITPAFELSGGGRFEHEHGTFDAGNRQETTRKNGGAFVEGRVNIRSRVHVNGGVGFEDNAVFGNAIVPRVSIAGYVRIPSATSVVGDTKLTFNAGRGIKAPSLFQEQQALAAVIPSDSPLAASIPSIGPERSRSFDGGIEQGFWRGRSRVRVSYFHNEFTDLIQFLSKNVLPQIGVPVAVADATQFGAYVNASSYTAQGVETSAEAAFGSLKIVGSYTFLDAEVTKSLGGGALSPAFNPAFPDIPIGAFEPLVGARPFRRPTHAGTVMVSYAPGPAQVALSAFFAGRQDDSTFLSDEFFGNSLLLPNHNMNDSYQKVDLSGSYRVHENLRWYLTLENLLNQKYESASGFPALPATVRTGVTIVVGGASGQTP